MKNLTPNTFKTAIREGRTTYGIWNGIPHVYAGEICAGAGFDWVVVDGEHAPFDLQSMIHQVQSIELHGIPAIVRIPNDDASVIKQLLDAGARNIIVPMIESGRQAEGIARSMSYPPRGIRGVGTALSRAAQWNRVKDYFNRADKEVCCIAQVESVRGVEALDEILDVEGIDVILLGPADLAASMGLLGQPGHSEVVEQVKRCIKRIVAAGKAAGFLTVSDRLIREYRDCGATMVGVGLDSLLLAKATEALAREWK